MFLIWFLRVPVQPILASGDTRSSGLAPTSDDL